MDKHLLKVLGALLLVVVASRAHADAASVLPHFYAEPGISKDRKLVASEAVSDHVDPFSGSLGLSYVDLYLPGNGGLDIKIERHYTSNIWLSRDNPYSFAPYPSTLLQPTAAGAGWTMHLGRVVLSERSGSNVCEKFANVIDDTTQNNAVLELPDGGMQVLYVSSTGIADFITRSNWLANCYGMSEGLTVYAPNGLKYTMNHKIHAPETGNYADYPVNVWFPTRIEDAKGNFLAITYTGGRTGSYAHIDKITASDGREVVFAYTNGVLTSVSTTAAIGASSETWTYEYIEAGTLNGHKLLTKVIRPDGSQWLYTYNPGSAAVGPWAMATVTGPYGGQVSYTYEHVDFQGPVAQLAGKDRYYAVAVKTRTVTNPNGASGAWTYAYQPGTDTTLEPNYKNDITVVEYPGGREVYRHYGIQRQVGYLGVDAFELWKTGMLGKKEIYDTGCSGSGEACDPGAGTLLRTETYVWQAPSVISDEINIVAPFDLEDYGGVYYPQLLSKTVTQDGTTYTTQHEYDNSSADPRPARTVETGEATRTTELLWYPASPQGVWLWDQTISEIQGSDYGLKKLRQFDYANATLTWQWLNGLYEEYTYTSQGDVKTRTNSLGYIWQYDSYYRGLPRTEVHPVNDTHSISISRAANSDGTVASETNGRGFTTGYSYDELRRLTGITPPINAAVAVEWGINIVSGQGDGFKRKVSRGDYREYTLFDGFGRAVCVDVTNAAGSLHVTTTFRYDIRGNKVFESQPFEGSCESGSASATGETFTYDALGRPTRVTHADGSFRTFAYLVGNRVQTTNERNFVTTQSYRAYGEPGDKVLMRVDAPENVTTVFARNLLGQVLSVTQGERDAQGNVTNGVTRTYTYDPNYNHLTSETNPETGVTFYGRDVAGNMIARAVGASGTTHYTYDYSNRLTLVDHPTPTADVLYSYDDNNALLTAATDSGWTVSQPMLWLTNETTKRTYTYDENDNLKTEQIQYKYTVQDGGVQNAIESKTLAVSYGYNTLDAVESITYPSGLQVALEPDALARPTRIGGFVTGIGYHPTGQPSYLLYGNGRRTDIELDARQWTRRISTAGGLADLRYQYDGAGNVQAITDAVSSALNRAMTYDGLDRLATADGVWGSGTYAYDAIGNIRTKTLGAESLSYQYDAGNRLASITGSRAYSFSYDSYGNIVSNNDHLFTYNDAGDLAQVSGASTASYVYDADHRRLRSNLGSYTDYHLYSKSGLLLGDYRKGSAEYKEYLHLGSKLVAMHGYELVPPTANAGADAAVYEGKTAQLDGSASSDPDGTIVSYSWAQTAGPAVALNGANTATPSFTTPQVSALTTLTFKVVVTDNEGMKGEDQVDITVLDYDADTDSDGLPDAWEMYYLGSLVFGGTDDSDADGITNLREYKEGTNPTVAEPAPAAVTDLRAAGGDGRNVVVWSSVKSVARYDLYWGTSPGVTKANGNLIANVTSPYYHGVVPNNIAYYYVIVAVNNSGESASGEASAIPSTQMWLDTEVRQLANSESESVMYNVVGDGLLAQGKYNGTTYALQVTRYARQSGWGDPVTIVEGAPGTIMPSVYMTDSGKAVLAWKQHDGIRYNLWVSLGDATIGWTAPQLLENYNGGSYENGSVGGFSVRLNETGHAVAAWHQDEVRGSYVVPTIYANVYTPGSGWSGRVKLDGNDTAYSSTFVLRHDEGGYATVIWAREPLPSSTSPAYLYAKRYHPGKGWQPTVTVDSTGSPDIGYANVETEVYGDGNIVVCWTGDAYYTIATNCAHFENENWGSRQQVSDRSYQSMTGDVLGNVTMIWVQPGGRDSYDLVAKRYTTNGWQPAAVVASDYYISSDVYLSSGPRIAADAAGNLLVVFESQVRNGARTLYETRSSPGGAWSPRAAIGGHIPIYELSMNGLGEARLWWYESLSGGYNSWTRFFAVPNNISPVAGAGPDQTVVQKSAVTLNGSASSDPDGQIVSYAWKQLSGTTVILGGANTAVATFTAPAVNKTTPLNFELTVTDNGGATSTDQVVVTVTK